MNPGAWVTIAFFAFLMSFRMLMECALHWNKADFITGRWYVLAWGQAALMLFCYAVGRTYLAVVSG